MLKVYGSHLCSGCREAKEKLDNEGIEYEFLDITENLSYLKEFLKFRDNLDIYDEMKEIGRIGIPTFVYDDGTISLEYK